MIPIPAYVTRPYLQPVKASTEAAGYDLYARIDHPLRIAPGDAVRVPTGLHLELPMNFVAFITPRSGLADKYRISILNTPGVVDADYRGEIGVLLENRGRSLFVLEPEERFAQMVILEMPRVVLSFVDCLSDLHTSERGDGGFGSTGRG